MNKTIVTHASGVSVPEVHEDVLSAALSYAAARLYVVPVRAKTKNPGSILGKDWPNCSSRDPETITKWFQGADRDVAIHTGASGLVVFDVDAPEYVPPVLAELLTTSGCPIQSTRKLEVREWRSDQLVRGHYLFAVPDGYTLGCSGGAFGNAWGEVRAGNSVIMAAPSRHPEPDGEYVWLRRGPIPTLPTWGAGLLSRPRQIDLGECEDLCSDETDYHRLVPGLPEEMQELLVGNTPL